MKVGAFAMCGNLCLLGRLRPGETRALPARVDTLLQSMLHVTQLRGAQSGGGAIQLERAGLPRQIIEKCLNTKRGDLAERLTRSMRNAGKAGASGGSFIVQTHLRFATSGPATRLESHPFRFVEVAERGARRVFRPAVVEYAPSVRPVETAVTHNGDLHAMTFRGVRIPHPALGSFFERVLRTPNRWVGDSPSLAGAMELFLTQGMWLESLRLAYLEVLAPPPPDLHETNASLARTRLLAFQLPSHEELTELACIAERVWVSRRRTPHTGADRAALAQCLAEALQPGSLRLTTMATFARRALDCFLDNDLLRAARTLEAAVEGTFGCVISSTLEPDTVVAFARGQPLSLGVQTATGTVAIASERNALRVRDEHGRAVFDARLDLDLAGAEIARIALGDQLQPQLTLYCVSEQRNYARHELERSGRLVDLRNNPRTPPLPVEAKARVRQDLEDLPQILKDVRADYGDPSSNNRRSAETLAYALLCESQPRLLVLGITNDLWLAEQFVQNLKLCLPDVSARAISSNEFLSSGDTGLVEPGTVVLAISQSGQDFPTAAALCQLRTHFGESGHGRLFVLSGEADTLMGQAIGQSFSRRALWLGRILTNCAGYRPAEAATATVNATHATLCELLFVLRETAESMQQTHPRRVLAAADLEVLRARRDACIDRNVLDILSTPTGEVAQQIRRFSQRLSRHVLEGAAAYMLAAFVLQANLAFGWQLKPSWLLALLPEPLPSALRNALGAQLDIIYYLFLTPILIWLLRLLQRRPALHRQGTRELLIGDTAYVRKIVWLLSRKLFSLSYGFASLKPYAADVQDDLIMTHEPLRGTLALFGVPDGRRDPLRGAEAAAVMTAKQFASSRSLGGAGAEVITVGHSAGLSGFAHLSLPSVPIERSHRALDLLIEGMYDSWERMLAMQTLLTQLAETVSSFHPFGYDASRTKDQVFAPTTASPVSCAALLNPAGLAREALRFSRTSLPFEILSPPSAITLDRQVFVAERH